MTRPTAEQLYAERERIDRVLSRLTSRRAAIAHVLFPSFPAGHPKHEETVARAWTDYDAAAPLTDAELLALATLEARADGKGWRREAANTLCAAVKRLAGL